MVNKYIDVNESVESSKCCSECPSKVYCKDKYGPIRLGAGGRFATTFIIVPGYDTHKDNKYNPEKILEDIYKDSKGIDIYEECYITRDIKCVPFVDYKVNIASVKYCFKILLFELKMVKPKKIIVIGCGNVSDMLNDNNIFHVHINHFKSDNFEQQFKNSING